MPSKIITSEVNSRVKQVVKLREHKERLDKNLIIVEGMREIEQALKAKFSFRECYVCQDLKKQARPLLTELARQKEIEIFEIPDNVYQKISYGESRDGILAVCQPRHKTCQEITLSAKPLVLVIESIEKPGNLGAILRTADAAGMDAIFCCDLKTDIFNPNIIRSSLGAVFALNVVVADRGEVSRFLTDAQLKVAVSSPHAKTVYTKLDFNQPVAIVVGSEDKGVSDYWLDLADYKMKIPMRGQADSLNVSASTAIILYEAVRQREG